MGIKITQKPEVPEVAAEVIVQAVLDISTACKKVFNSRLSRRAVITLIHENSKVARRDIELVLNNLEELETNWLYKKPEKK